MERKIDRQIGVVSAMTQKLYRSVVVKRELSIKPKTVSLPVIICPYPH